MNILLYVSGAVTAATTPLVLHALDSMRPRDEVRVVLSRSARRFVTPLACGAGIRTVLTDDWDELSHGEHVELSRWPEVIVVYPATLNFVTRFSLGTADTPFLLAAQCSPARMIIAPALPPGGVGSVAFTGARDRLAGQERIVVLPTTSAPSRVLRQDSDGAPAAFTDVIDVLGRMEREVSG
ncbi:flavoprotein [Nocardia sp. NPDC003963]